MADRDPNEELLAHFATAEHQVDDAVRAWDGAYPLFGGYTNVGMLFTKWRALALVADQIQVWSTWSGLPSKLLWSVDATECGIFNEGRKFDIYRVGPGHTVWTARQDRERLRRWSAHR